MVGGSYVENIARTVPTSPASEPQEVLDEERPSKMSSENVEDAEAADSCMEGLPALPVSIKNQLKVCKTLSVAVERLPEKVIKKFLAIKRRKPKKKSSGKGWKNGVIYKPRRRTELRKNELRQKANLLKSLEASSDFRGDSSFDKSKADDVCDGLNQKDQEPRLADDRTEGSAPVEENGTHEEEASPQGHELPTQIEEEGASNSLENISNINTETPEEFDCEGQRQKCLPEVLNQESLPEDPNERNSPEVHSDERSSPGDLDQRDPLEDLDQTSSAQDLDQRRPSEDVLPTTSSLIPEATQDCIDDPTDRILERILQKSKKRSLGDERAEESQKTPLKKAKRLNSNESIEKPSLNETSDFENSSESSSSFRKRSKKKHKFNLKIVFQPRRRPKKPEVVRSDPQVFKVAKVVLNRLEDSQEPLVVKWKIKSSLDRLNDVTVSSCRSISMKSHLSLEKNLNGSEEVVGAAVTSLENPPELLTPPELSERSRQTSSLSKPDVPESSEAIETRIEPVRTATNNTEPENEEELTNCQRSRGKPKIYSSNSSSSSRRSSTSARSRRSGASGTNLTPGEKKPPGSQRGKRTSSLKRYFRTSSLDSSSSEDPANLVQNQELEPLRREEAKLASLRIKVLSESTFSLNSESSSSCEELQWLRLARRRARGTLDQSLPNGKEAEGLESQSKTPGELPDVSGREEESLPREEPQTTEESPQNLLEETSNLNPKLVTSENDEEGPCQEVGDLRSDSDACDMTKSNDKEQLLMARRKLTALRNAMVVLTRLEDFEGLPDDCRDPDMEFNAEDDELSGLRSPDVDPIALNEEELKNGREKPVRNGDTAIDGNLFVRESDAGGADQDLLSSSQLTPESDVEMNLYLDENSSAEATGSDSEPVGTRSIDRTSIPAKDPLAIADCVGKNTEEPRAVGTLISSPCRKSPRKLMSDQTELPTSSVFPKNLTNLEEAVDKRQDKLPQISVTDVTTEAEKTPTKSQKCKQQSPARTAKSPRPKIRSRIENLTCSVCSVDFATVQDLSEHIFRHSAEELQQAYRSAKAKERAQSGDPTPNREEPSPSTGKTSVCQVLTGSDRSNSLPQCAVTEIPESTPGPSTGNHSDTDTAATCPCHKGKEPASPQKSDLQVRTTFSTRRNLELREKSCKPEREVENTEKQSAVWNCDVCLVSFAERKELNRHSRIKHEQHYLCVATSPVYQAFMCSRCFSMKRTVREIEEHWETSHCDRSRGSGLIEERLEQFDIESSPVGHPGSASETTTAGAGDRIGSDVALDSGEKSSENSQETAVSEPEAREERSEGQTEVNVGGPGCSTTGTKRSDHDQRPRVGALEDPCVSVVLSETSRENLSAKLVIDESEQDADSGSDDRSMDSYKIILTDKSSEGAIKMVFGRTRSANSGGSQGSNVSVVKASEVRQGERVNASRELRLARKEASGPDVSSETSDKSVIGDKSSGVSDEAVGGSERVAPEDSEGQGQSVSCPPKEPRTTGQPPVPEIIDIADDRDDENARKSGDSGTGPKPVGIATKNNGKVVSAVKSSPSRPSRPMVSLPIHIPAGSATLDAPAARIGSFNYSESNDSSKSSTLALDVDGKSFEELRLEHVTKTKPPAEPVSIKKPCFLRVKTLSELQGIKAYSCNVCKAAFESTALLEEHCQRHLDRTQEKEPRSQQGIMAALVLPEKSVTVAQEPVQTVYATGNVVGQQLISLDSGLGQVSAPNVVVTSESTPRAWINVRTQQDSAPALTLLNASCVGMNGGALLMKLSAPQAVESRGIMTASIAPIATTSSTGQAAAGYITVQPQQQQQLQVQIQQQLQQQIQQQQQLQVQQQQQQQIQQLQVQQQQQELQVQQQQIQQPLQLQQAQQLQQPQQIQQTLQLRQVQLLQQPQQLQQLQPQQPRQIQPLPPQQPRQIQPLPPQQPRQIQPLPPQQPQKRGQQVSTARVNPQFSTSTTRVSGFHALPAMVVPPTVHVPKQQYTVTALRTATTTTLPINNPPNNSPIAYHSDKPNRYHCNICNTFRCNSVGTMNNHVMKHYAGFSSSNPNQNSNQATAKTSSNTPCLASKEDLSPQVPIRRSETDTNNELPANQRWFVKNTPQGPVLMTGVEAVNEENCTVSSDNDQFTGLNLPHQINPTAIAPRGGIQAYRCLICKSTVYNTHSTILNHLLIDHGINESVNSYVQKVYFCLHCPRVPTWGSVIYDSDEDLTQHLHSCHPNTCPICRRNFATNYSMKAHLARCNEPLTETQNASNKNC